MLSSEVLRNNQDAIDEDDREAMAREVERVENSRQADSEAKKATQQSMSSSHATRSGPANTSGAKVAQPMPLQARDPNAFVARNYIPDVRGCALAKDETSHHRWIICDPSLPGEQKIFTRSWGVEKSPARALNELLAVLWEWRQSHGGNRCSFNLADAAL